MVLLRYFTWVSQILTNCNHMSHGYQVRCCSISSCFGPPRLNHTFSTFQIALLIRLWCHARAHTSDFYCAGSLDHRIGSSLLWVAVASWATNSPEPLPSDANSSLRGSLVHQPLMIYFQFSKMTSSLVKMHLNCVYSWLGKTRSVMLTIHLGQKPLRNNYLQVFSSTKILF